jgi:hypothetical protein
MAIEKQGDFWFGDGPADTVSFLTKKADVSDWAFRNTPLKDLPHLPCAEVALAICACGNNVWHLQVDDEDHIRSRTCADCKRSQSFSPDEQSNLSTTDTFPSECECGNELMNIASGLVTADGLPAPYVIVAVRCTRCGHLEFYAVREMAHLPEPEQIDKRLWLAG